MMILGIAAGLILLFVVYFIQPYSPLKSDFSKTAEELISGTQSQIGTFSQKDIARLPVPVQNYFIHCGYIDTPKMAWVKTAFNDVSFSTGRNKSTLTIDYTQYNFVETPNRLAYIDSSMYGIPFQGFDSYTQGVGSMKGVIAKAYTLFDQKGPEMDKACLVTILSESLFIPNIALQDYITWEAIDDTHAKASITAYGTSASGFFTFNEEGEALEFTTNDRMAVGFDGSKQSIPWSAVCEGYQKNENGILKPTRFKAVWHYPEGDLVYFDGKIKSSDAH